MGGVDYALSPDLVLSYQYGELDQVYGQHYLGLLGSRKVGPGKLALDARYFISDDTGQARAGRVDNRTLNVLLRATRTRLMLVWQLACARLASHGSRTSSRLRTTSRMGGRQSVAVSGRCANSTRDSGLRPSPESGIALPRPGVKLPSFSDSQWPIPSRPIAFCQACWSARACALIAKGSPHEPHLCPRLEPKPRRLERCR
ncbi:OprD family outer membrane porin [Pseudomonas putida]|uniref:OprD family outer membrane porin n=1 Tax=Pseudomonas putida TaxID=303 RepID=UPI00095218B2